MIAPLHELAVIPNSVPVDKAELVITPLLIVYPVAAASHSFTTVLARVDS